jgi:integrase
MKPHESDTPALHELFARFRANWILIGNSPATLKEYDRHLRQLLDATDNPTLLEVETWLANEPSMPVRRMKARAVRAFGRWLREDGADRLGWWQQVPLAKEVEKEQPTVSAEDYEEFASRHLPLTVRLIVELLWSTGMRRSELARVLVTDVNLEQGTIQVGKSKTDQPRLVPLTDEAIELVRRHLENHSDPRLVGRTSESIRKLLRDHGMPSAHCFRRGWAVDSLRRGMNQVDVETAAGWSSGAMVRRYTKKFRNQVAIENFRRNRSSSKPPTNPND